MTFEILIGILERMKEYSDEQTKKIDCEFHDYELGYSSAMDSCIKLLKNHKDEILTETKKTKKTTKGE